MQWHCVKRLTRFEEAVERTMMRKGLCPLPGLYEMEPFVRICHGHFPLKQCTLEANPHLLGINWHRLMMGKLRTTLFYAGVKLLSVSV